MYKRFRKHLPDKYKKSDEELMEPDADIMPIGARIGKYWLRSALILFKTGVKSFFNVMKNIATPLKARWKNRLDALHNMKDKLMAKGLEKYKSLKDANALANQSCAGKAEDEEIDGEIDENIKGDNDAYAIIKNIKRLERTISNLNNRECE